MALTKSGKYEYGEDQSDLRAYLGKFSTAFGHPVDRFAAPVCTCGSTQFGVFADVEAGVAIPTCARCGKRHFIGESEEFAEDVHLKECTCPCGGEAFEVRMGASLYKKSDEVRWLFLGLRCVACGLVACYGDWKNEYAGYADLLKRV